MLHRDIKCVKVFIWEGNFLEPWNVDTTWCVWYIYCVFLCESKDVSYVNGEVGFRQVIRTFRKCKYMIESWLPYYNA